jgi:hypothetical protein
MAIAYNTSIVRDGLVVYLDAANPKSYPGTGNTWFDLTGNGNNLTRINSPTWNSNYFSTGATGYFSGAGTASIPIGNSQYTMIVWARQNTSWGSARGIISIGGFNTQHQSNALRTQSNTNVGNFHHYWWNNDLSANNNNAGLAINTWFMVTAQFDGTNRRIWANKTNVSSDTPSNHNVLSTAIQVGVTYIPSSEYFQGDIGAVYIYNKALTNSEIKKIFEALRGRYGI